jgi:peptidyl-prolyl cis-trans isomerase C
LRLLIFAALTASIAAIPCAALAASKAPPEKASPPTAAAERQKAFVTVNGVAISEIEAKIAMEDRRTAGAADSPALQNSVRTQLVARELFAQQARKQGLDKDKSLLARVRMSSEEILARSYQLDFMARQQIADEQVRKEYDTTKQRSGDKEFRLRQLILATEDEAKGVIARVRGGESMQSLAASSRDESSRNRGGDLGWIPQGNLLPQFAEAVAKLGRKAAAGFRWRPRLRAHWLRSGAWAQPGSGSPRKKASASASTAGGFSSGAAWPTPGITRSTAPGMPACSRRAW